MPTIDELHAADQEHAAALAALKARTEGHEKMIAENSANIQRHEELISNIRERLGGLATKGDILDLRKDLSNFNQQQLLAAQNSLSPKMAAWCGVGMLILSLAGFALAHFK